MFTIIKQASKNVMDCISSTKLDFYSPKLDGSPPSRSYLEVSRLKILVHSFLVAVEGQDVITTCLANIRYYHTLPVVAVPPVDSRIG